MAERPPGWLGQLSGSRAEARQRADRDRRQREREGQREGSIILSPTDVRGEYDAARLLETTLGGVRREITAQDLAAFKKNIKTVQKRFRAGITAQQVVNLSLGIDRTRASTEIRVSIPSRAMKGKVFFLTDAGPDSDVKRHHVTVEFMSYQAAAVSPSPAKEMAKWLRTQPLKFDCDCGRHRYWYRYIATVGQFAAGRPETGYPKIRNPRLVGVACKHVLRTMSEIIRGSHIQSFLERLIDKAQRHDMQEAVIRTSQRDAEKLARNMAKRSKARRTINVSEAPPPRREAAGSRRLRNVTTGEMTPDQIALLRQYGLTPAQIREVQRRGGR